MKIRPLVVLGFILMLMIFVSLSLPVAAAPAAQGVQFATNTPLPDGRILYQVQPGNTCTQIALLHGISIEQLRQLNTNLDANCTLVVGSLLLVGLGGPAAASATPGPSPTPLPPTITPTPFVGTTEICVELYNDVNGDALRETGEPPVVGGAVSVTETDGKYSKTLNTDATTDPLCFTDVPEGNYNISAAIPDAYNPTTSLSTVISVKAGDQASVDFGAQSRESGQPQPGGSTGGGGPSPLLGIFGGILLLGGLGLGWYSLRLRKPASKLKQSGLLRR